jgi:hypothetical protein
MAAQAAASFEWVSPLGGSVALFALFGLLSVMVGVLTPFLIRADAAESLLFSAPSDTVLFGGVPSELVAQDRALGTLRWLLLLWLAAVLLAFGLLQAVVWFGLREGQVWALYALTIADLATLPYWAAMIQTYVRQSAPLSAGDVPPLFTSLLLIPIAAILGWIGLQR